MDELTRREFLRVAATVSLMMPFGFSGCRRPEAKIVSFSKPYGDVKPGQAIYYATAMPSRMSALPLIVKNVDYHPVKLEGNPLYPKGGGTNRFAQATLFSLYDPLRSSRFLIRGKETMVETDANDVWRIVQGTRRELENGAGLCILTGQTSSPAFERMIGGIIEKYPQTKWFVYEPIDLDYPNYAASKMFGDDVCVLYDLRKANVIVSLDCDFLDSEEDAIFSARDFISSREPNEMSRLYSVEAGYSLTGANSDNRLTVSSSLVQAITAGIAYKIFSAKNMFDDSIIKKLKDLSAPADKYNNAINIFVKDLLNAYQSADKKPIVMVGYRQPLIVHCLALAINFALDSVGRTVFIKKRNRLKPSGSIYDLAQLLKQDSVKTLVISNANPIYDAPVNLDWRQIQHKAQRVIRLGLYEDETSAESDIHIPLKHFLECWGDARSLNGTLLSIQPVVQPVWNGVSEIEFFARLLGDKDSSDYDIARHTSNFKTEDWHKYVSNGFAPNSEWKDFSGKYDYDALRKIIDSGKVVSPGSGIEINYYRSPAVDDGRYFTNVWLQETPDPITKVVWDNPALISPNTARRFGITERDVVVQTNAEVIEIQLKGRSARCPVVIQPGMVDDVVALTLGYGRRINSDFGKMNFEIGFNAFKLLNGDNPYFESGAELKIVSGSYEHIARVQPDSKNPDEDVIIEVELSKYKAEPNFVKKILDNANKKTAAVKTGQRLYKSTELNGNHQWAMAIDLNKCIGCGVCVLACRSENNIPVVGKEEALRRREMDWLRVDRYYYETKQGVKVRFQPLMCMQCETAPCEYVCPVNATVHDSEGLNLMVYNRCIGARYCLNNCPYKVRRFNYFDYNKRIAEEIYNSGATDDGLIASALKKLIAKGNDTAIENLLALVRNPEVTVRMRGIMEKCTYCIQRIQNAKAEKKIKAGDSPNVLIEDGAVKTACQQACPVNAIIFGNLSDPNSEISKTVKQNRNYGLLGYLNTKPRTTYLAKITNQNPEFNADLAEERVNGH